MPPSPSPTPPTPNPTPSAEEAPKLDEETRLLAALCYGESSTANVFEEMAGIANVVVRQAKARGKTVKELLESDTTFAFAASDGNKRYAAFKKASDEATTKDAGMSNAVRAAQNALAPAGTDYSNGAYFWDGADIKTNYASHAKVVAGIKFSDKAHNIYGIEESGKLIIVKWQKKNKKTGKIEETTERGRYDHVYISTAAYGGTIFWKYNPDFIKATGNKEYK